VVTHSIEVAETAERRIHLRNGRAVVEGEARVAVSALRRIGER
jgi:ABC-type lipoprotein export system ATPase subunit